MGEDGAFLRAVIASPEDATARLVYADWLDERSDPRGGLLRGEWDVPRLSFVDWVAREGDLDFYLKSHSELDAREHEANRRWRETLGALPPSAREWGAVVDTLGRPFRPFFFWNNTGPRAFQDGELPFLERIGTRGPVVTFESAFRGERAWEPGLSADLEFLCRLEWGMNYYGSAGCPLHPFVGELDSERSPLTGTDVIRALKAAYFRSRHIPTLDVPEIAFPGYNPGPHNDEVHTDADQQHMFPHPDEVPDDAEEEDVIDGPAASHAVHTALRGAVVGGRLWYVLLHGRTGPPAAETAEEDDGKGDWVVLFAVGRSRRGNRLIGAVSHQLCHNFCD